MSNKTLEEKIKVMQHYLNGGKILFHGVRDTSIESLPSKVLFNWEQYDYSIYEEPKTLPSIDWSHVSEEYKYLTVDDNGSCWLSMDEPYKDYDFWIGNRQMVEAIVFSSFKQGTCDWKDSLVKRPE